MTTPTRTALADPPDDRGLFLRRPRCHKQRAIAEIFLRMVRDEEERATGRTELHYDVPALSKRPAAGPQRSNPFSTSWRR